MKNILLFNDTEGNYHFGCTATSLGSSSKLGAKSKNYKKYYTSVRPVY